MNLFFDLDGTLTDPVVGITRCIQHALRGLGREPPAMAQLARFVGPPLRANFAELLATADGDLIAQAVTLYRERFATIGLFENVVYADIPAALATLAAADHRLFVVTSKPHVFARRILEHFQLTGWFRQIYGSDLDGRHTDKADLIRVVLEHEKIRPDVDETWMIGDRAPDVQGGRANATRTAGVLWGYGTEPELRAAAPDLLVGSVAELVAHLSRH